MSIVQLKKDLVKAMRDLKDSNLYASARKDAYNNIISISGAISKLDDKFELDTTILENFKKYKPVDAKNISPKVVWYEYDGNGQFKDLEEFFGKLTALSVKIVHNRLPQEKIDSDKFGTIVNATLGHLINLINTPHNLKH